jgi:membrane protein implicated in regulation of membrane protease activity
MEKTRYFLLIAAILGQMIGYMLLFVNVKLALLFFVIYAVMLVILLLLLMKERKKEKREDDQNDYRDY